jgi:hypothetical protein
MEEAYKNWKLLLESKDKNNVNLALSLTASLEIDKKIVKLDVLAAYFYLIYKKYSSYLWAEDFTGFVDWGSKNGINLWQKSRLKNIIHNDGAFNIINKILAFNPDLSSKAVYGHISLLHRDFFMDLIESGKHELLSAKSWLACFKAHNCYREEVNKVFFACLGKKIPDIVFSWDAITCLYLDDYKLYHEKNITLLYQLKNLEELRIYGLEMFRSMPLDLNQLPKLEKIVFFQQTGNIFCISTGDYLKVLELYNIDEETLDNLLTYTPNLRVLNIRKYKGSKLPESISQLQQLEELGLQEINQRLDLSGLKNLPKLSILNLQASRFRQLPLLVDLVDLNISYCDLDALPFVLNEMPRLEKLNIGYNRIFFFKPKIIRQLLLQLKIFNVESAFASEKGDDEIMQIAADIGSQTSINPPKQGG